jgi:hypothetical protein
VEEIEPAQGDDGGERRIGSLLELRLEAPHPSEATKDRLSHNAAEAVGPLSLGVRKMIEAPAVLMTPGKMFQQVAQGRDAELFKRGELGTSDPAQPF